LLRGQWWVGWVGARTPNAGMHNDPPEMVTLRAGRPKVGIWCMIFVNDFSKVFIVLVYENVCWIRY